MRCESGGTVTWMCLIYQMCSYVRIFHTYIIFLRLQEKLNPEHVPTVEQVRVSPDSSVGLTQEANAAKAAQLVVYI